MKILTLDFETYYDKAYSLSKITTEEYIRSDLFQVVGIAVAVDDAPAVWFSGTMDETRAWLQQFDWVNSFVLAHNTQFDGAILSWRFGIKPKGWLDTLCMARAIHGVDAGGSLKALAERYQIGEKGNEVVSALGLRREDFPEAQLAQYGEYCKNDVHLTRTLFHRLMMPGLGAGFPPKELKVIDTTLRMFIDPTLRLNLPMLESHLENVKEKKRKLLEAAEADKDSLMSNDKFAELLRLVGVEPPKKISLRTGKEAWAFAKTDEEFKDLLEHPDVRVQALVAARLGNKTTLEETRTQRFIDIALRGALPVPIKYYAAHTGRWGGDDKINLQNLPSRGQNANRLKLAIEAPPGYVVIDSDSSQIEARTVAWLAGQTDLVEAFENGEDVYKIMASSIYGKPMGEITKEERFVGKTVILGCISEGTLVLCDSGWKPIESVSTHDRLWDGEEWVCHQGLLNKGTKQTLNLCGAWLTPDHKVWSGTHWLEAQSVVADEDILSQALGIAAANLPSQAMYKAPDLASSLLSSNAIVRKPNTLWTGTTSKISKALDALFAQKKPVTRNGIGFTQPHYLMTSTARGYSTGSPLPLPVATTPNQSTTLTMGQGGLLFARNGATIGQRFLNMCKHLMGGITRSSKWIGQTTTRGISPAISNSYPALPTCGTGEMLEDSNRRSKTYDLAYAGPRNRFTILTERGPVIVHNCGYGMGSIKFQLQLKTFGVDIPIDECKRIIETYRATYQQIPALWKDAQRCLEGIVSRRSTSFGAVDVVQFDPEQSGFLLPSGLWQRYEGIRKFESEGGPQYEYSTRRGPVKIYGGKIVENLCQAIARCVIAEQMLRIAKRYKVVLTVHDAVACIAPEAEAEEAQKYVEECMRWRPSWASTLPLNCESGIGKSYGEC